MKKLVNFRPVLLSAACFAVGILCADFFPVLKAFSFIIPVASVLFCSVLYFILYRRKNLLKITLVSLYFCAVCLLGTGSLLLKVGYISGRSVTEGVYDVQGEIKEYYKNGEYANIILGNCVTADGKTGDIYIANYNGEGKLYEVVETTLKLSPVKTGTTRLNGLAKKGVSSVADTVYYSAVKGRSESLHAKFVSLAENVFYGGMDEREARVALAMFTGVTYGMSEEIGWYRSVGLAHIFAVSGLHVGMLFGALAFLFSLLKIKRIPKACLSSAAVFFYAYLCGLSASCVRAAVMCAVFSFTQALGEKPDRINSLSFAFAAVLLIDPADIFSVGFILSFTVSFSLIILSSPIKRALGFLPEKIAALLSGLIAAHLASAPVCIIAFGYFPFSALLMNILFLPILSFTYYFLWITFIFGAIFPATVTVAAFVPSLFLYGTDEIAAFAASFPLTAKVFPVPLAAAYYPVAIIGSDLVNTGKKIKAACFSFLFVSLAVCGVVGLI